jgi:hypothetical protein
MTTIPNDAMKRIRDARRQAESDLKASLALIEGDDITPYLHAFTSLAITLYDAEAEEVVELCNESASLEGLLREVAARIIESILPDRGLKKVRDSRPENELSIIQEVGSRIIYEEKSGGETRPAGEYVQGIFARHGYWERFMPLPIGYFIRFRDNARVREELSHALQQREFYWIGAFALWVRPATRPYNREQIRAINADTSVQRKLNLALIGKFIEEEGYTNDDLATKLNISSRAVSSLRNDGDYHGAAAFTKLANLMKCEVEDLFLS